MVMEELEVDVAVTKCDKKEKIGAISKKSALTRLSCMALALPGITTPVDAARVDENFHADIQMATYSESDERMTVDVYETAFSAPVGEHMDLHVDIIKDVISGASPQFNIIGVDGKPEQIFSGASIREERDVVNIGSTYYWDDYSFGVSAGQSDENDYLARYVKGQFDWDLNQKMTTLSAAYSTSFDEIEPTGETYREDKRTYQLLLGVTQILDQHSLFNSNLTYGKNRGFLSDPYKKVFFTRAGIALDKRPDSRYQWAWLNRYVRTFKDLNKAALHVDYRFYRDNWEVKSHTLEVSWHQPLGDGWELVPRIRYYGQDKAEFYQAYFTTPDGLDAYSSDYRLADFGALSGGINIVNRFEQGGKPSKIKVRFGFEFYDRRASYHWSSDDDDFADYHSLTFSAGLSFEF